MAYNPQDRFFKKAKQEGYKARSIYKLEEIHQRWKILRPSDAVLDLGCAPGSWSQYVLKVLGPQGSLLALDLTPVTLKDPRAQFLTKDIFEMKTEEFVGSPYNVILSDMAPKTTGVVFADQAKSEALCEQVLDLTRDHLRPGGKLVMKLFMGGGAQELIKKARVIFEKVELLKPEGTRKESKEIFIVGLGFRSRK